MLLVGATSIVAAPPFVAGFDRFGSDPDIQVGSVLLTELGCTACHVDVRPTLQPKQGPTLDGVGVRLNQNWIHQFLDSPQQTKPGTTMPDLFVDWDSESKHDAVEALVAFLASQQAPFPELNSTASNPIATKFWDKGDPDRGQTLYHRVGCVACHQPDSSRVVQTSPPKRIDPEELVELGIHTAAVGSVPLPDLNAKYSPQSLTHFLIDPLAIRPSGRMPNMKLSPHEAADITAYLLLDQTDLSPTVSATPDTKLISTGKSLFQQIGCANCHAVGGLSSNLEARPLAALRRSASSSCIAQPLKGMPRYDVSPQQQTAIEQAIANPKVNDPADHRMLQLNCFVCHQRDGRGGVGPHRRDFFETVSHVDLGDEGRLPPALDGVGGKLTTHWLRNVLAGKGDVRPHMTIRMPIFGGSSDSLVDDLARADLARADSTRADSGESAANALNTTGGPADVGPADVGTADVGPADVGRQLFDIGCVQCHPIGGEKLSGVIGVDVADIQRRVRPQWFRAFLLDPAELKQRTRMPSFFRNGTSSSPELLAGNVDRQIESLWAYLNQTDKYPLPDKIQQGRAHDFELVPEDKPIILRTFMDQAGPHAIAVGFPEGVHLAFDAESVRIAQFWRGKFLDAHATWFDRFTPPTKPLGSNLVVLADSSIETNPSDRSFGGYRLDADGIPTFLYRIGNVKIEDRFTPTDQQMFQRTLRLSLADGQNDPVTIPLLPIAGNNLKRQSDREYRNETGMTVRWIASTSATSWSTSVEPTQPTEITLEYQW